VRQGLNGFICRVGFGHALHTGVVELLHCLRNGRTQRGFARLDEADLKKVIALLEKQIATKDPGLISKGLTKLQNVVMKAAGGLAAHGVIALLNQILGTGVPL
jgi:hypothetical protein